MAIADPHAIPETPELCKEYLTEADAAYDGGDSATAWDLYYSLHEARASTHDQYSHAAYRLALIALGRDDHENAYRFAEQSTDPGAAEIIHMLRNLNPLQPDPDRVPTGIEQVDEYWKEGNKAADSKDFATAARWFGAIVQATGLEITVTAWAEVVLAKYLHELGDDTTARAWLEKALPNINDGSEAMAAATELSGQIGVRTVVDNSSPAAAQYQAGLEAFRLGDTAAARTAFEATMHLDGADDELKGKAEYYLGSIDFHAHQYANARDHLEHAVEKAPDPEKTWAQQLLQEHWQENA
jgi:tetratricopeptide (TPR) repeat protein